MTGPRRTFPMALGAAAYGVAALALQPTGGFADEVAPAAPVVDPAAPQTGTNPATDDPSPDFLRPANMFQIYYEYKTAPGKGVEPGTIDTVTTDILNLRANFRIDLAPQWAMGLRFDLPLDAKDPVNSSDPTGDYVYGLGDADVQIALTHGIDARWSYGFGARLYTPTGEDAITSGKWRIMPGFAVRYALPELSTGSYVEPLVRYDQSFAGDPTKKSISNLQFQPTFNIGLPNRWFFTLYPSADIRWNFGPPATGQTGRLFLPFDAAIGRKFANNLALTLEVGVPIIREYPVYDFKTKLTLNVNF